MKRLKLNLKELKVDSFETTKDSLINRGTAKAYCDETSNETKEYSYFSYCESNCPLTCNTTVICQVSNYLICIPPDPTHDND
ncbi:MAG: pinensin family lanthipeptide [Ignavibacteria bacterium]|jgi:hypothetical protein